MNQQLFDLILMFTVVGTAFFLFYQVVQLIKTRPDVVAVLSFAAVAVGFGMMGLSDVPIQGLSVAGAGIVGVFIACLNYRRIKS